MSNPLPQTEARKTRGSVAEPPNRSSLSLHASGMHKLWRQGRALLAMAGRCVCRGQDLSSRRPHYGETRRTRLWSLPRSPKEW
jgi:hypothetical protein